MLPAIKAKIDLNMAAFLAACRKRYGLGAAPSLLSSCIEDFASRKGKRLRPILFVLAYLGYTAGKKPSLANAARAAASIELLHDFFLVHDDVIDRSALRRGKPTMHRVLNRRLGEKPKSPLGADLAIVTGDIMFAMAVEALMEIDEPPARKVTALKEFTRSAALTGAGEFIDVLNGARKIGDISRKDVFTTYDLKTAGYTFQAPLMMGAALAGAGKAELGKLSRLGLALGRAFQIQDDLLDMFSSRKKIGKPTLSDLGESKKTLLVWKAYRDLSPKDRNKLKRFLEKGKKTYADLLSFRALIKKSGAHEYCADMVRALLRDADKDLSRLGMKTKQKKLLAELIAGLFKEARNKK